MAAGWSSMSGDQTSADRNNAAIRSLATVRNLPFIDLHNAMHGNSLTVDGVHLTAAAYGQWRERSAQYLLSAWVHRALWQCCSR